MDLTPDTTKLTAEQRDKLDLYNMSKTQGDALQALEQKMASFTPEMQMKISNLADLKQDLTPILDALKALEAKEQPDTTSAIVDAVGKLEKALGAIDFKPSFTPEVKVDAPQVNVTAPKVNLTGVEKAVKDVSSAVKDAIAQIPTVDVPETDFTPLLEKLDLVLEQLADIDKGVRTKPQPGTMKVTNTDGTPIQTGLIPDEIMYGSIMSNGGTVVMPVVNGMAGWMMGYYGTYATGASLTMEASFDGGLTYSSVRMLQGASGVLGYVITIAAVSNSTSYFIADIPNGATHLQVRCSAWAAPTGSINLVLTQTSQRFSAPVATQTVTTLTNITNWGNIVDNAAFTDGTTRLSPNGYIYDEVAGTALTENDAAAARVDEKRAQIMIIEDGTTRGRRATVNSSGGMLVDLGAAGTSATSLGKAEDAAHVNGDTGVAMLAVRDDTLNSTSGTEGDYEMLHTTATGGLWVTQAPSTSGGWSTAMMSSADGSTALTATAQAIKASAGTFGGYYIYNPNSAATYVHIYNVAFGSVTVGTTNPQCTFCIPPTAGANLEIGNGVNFTTAMSVAATTTGGGNTAPASALECVFWFA